MVGTVVVVVLGGIVVIVGGRVVVVGGGVVVGVLRIGLTGDGELAGDVATGGLFTASRELPGRDESGVPDDVLPGNGGEVVTVVPTTFVVVVVPLAVAVGTGVVPFTCRKECVGGGASVSALAHTTPVTVSTATTSATPGYQTPSR